MAKSPAQSAATLAWTAPATAFIFSFVSKNISNATRATFAIILAVALLLYMTGLVSGVVALSKRAPREPRVLTPAIIGIAISCLCLLVVGSVFVANL